MRQLTYCAIYVDWLTHRMSAHPAQSVVCPVLIGRESALNRLVSLIDEVAQRRGQVVFITGEAGIGKSRLGAELRAHFLRLPRRTSGASGSQSEDGQAAVLALQGRCFETDRALPYAPVIDLLRAFLVSCELDELSSYIGTFGSELIKLLPELSTLVPGLTPSAPLDPEMEKRRLNTAISHMLTQLALHRPVMLTIEDVHWSDEASLEFLLGLARQVPTTTILLLITYRNDQTSPILDNFIAALNRERLATEVLLTHLSRNEVGAMLQGIFDLREAVHPDFLASSYALTEGNPFFLEEVLKSLVTSGDIAYGQGGWNLKPITDLHIPRSAQIAIQSRTSGLIEEARYVLSLAAVAGRRFDFDLLLELTGLGEGALLQTIKELIRAQLVVEESADIFAFRHALTRQAMYNDLLARERRTLHRQIADAIERVHASSLSAILGDLAYHFYEGQVWDKALVYARQAGEKASSLHSPRAAVEHFTRSLRAAHHLSVPQPLSVLKARAKAYELLGEFEGARADYALMIDAAREAQDKHSEWEALLDLGWLWTVRDYARAGEYIAEAVELAGQMGDPPTMAHTLNRAGNWHMHTEQPLRAGESHRQALAIFEAEGDRQGVASTLDLLGITSYMAGDVLGGVEYYERAVPVFRAIGDLEGLVNSLATLGMRGASFMSAASVCPVVSLELCMRDAEEAVMLASKLGWQAGEGMALGYMAHDLGMCGEYQEALDIGRKAVQLTREIEHRQWLVNALFALGGMHLDLFALSLAQEHLEEAEELAREIGSLFVRRVAASFLSSTYIAQGQQDLARSVLDEVISSDTPMETLAQRLAWSAYAEVEHAAGNPSVALRILEQLTASTPNIDERGGVVPRLWHLRGQALAAIDKLPEAEVVLRAAQVNAEQRGMKPILWRIHVSLGRLLKASSRRAESQSHFGAAHHLIAELAAKVPDEALRDNFVRQAHAMLPGTPSISPTKAAKALYGGLTRRECEVAVSIAQGKSNHAIAGGLVLSERTVEKHVENIMSKLGFASRAQIAAWVVEKGLN
jgi:DNA-binding CsgD family transcriptional regulator/tetratricopeptide (TPR) repeat protein